jgi:hypothetical protein
MSGDPTMTTTPPPPPPPPPPPSISFVPGDSLLIFLSLSFSHSFLNGFGDQQHLSSTK